MTTLPRLPSAVLSRVASVVCGDWPESSKFSSYRTHRELADFFDCDLGMAYGGEGMQGRARAVQDLLRSHNGTPTLAKIIEAAVHPSHYRSIEGGPTRAVEYLNEVLAPCGLRLEPYGRAYRFAADDHGLRIAAPGVDLASTGYVRELTDKADARLGDGDYEGAITTARTLVESVLVEIEQRVTGRRRDHERDLQGQFTVVRKLLRIDEEREDLDDSFKTMIKGLVQIINGLAPLRNKMSDGHARTRKPAPHHARFVVNASKSVAYFLVESYAYQVERGLLPSVASERTTL